MRVHSLQQRLAYASSDLDPAQALDVDTLLALEADEKVRGEGFFEEILRMSGMSGRKYRRLINRMI